MKKSLFMMMTLLLMNFGAVNAMDGKKARDGDTEHFVAALKILDPLIANIMSDIVKTTSQACGQALTVPALKTIMANDVVYHDILASASLDEHYLQSAAYRDVLNRHYGTCSSTARNNETEGS